MSAYEHESQATSTTKHGGKFKWVGEAFSFPLQTTHNMVLPNVVGAYFPSIYLDKTGT